MKNLIVKLCVSTAVIFGLLALSAGPAMADYGSQSPVPNVASDAELLAFIAANEAAAAAAFQAAGADDEVLGVTVPEKQLAFTGSNTNLRYSLGVGLIGAGALTMLAARKRAGS